MLCKWCNENPVSVNAVGVEVGEECDRCWELRMRIDFNPELASKMLAQLTMLAPDKGQAAGVKDNLGSAPCG